MFFLYVCQQQSDELFEQDVLAACICIFSVFLLLKDVLKVSWK